MFHSKGENNAENEKNEHKKRVKTGEITTRIE